ncbi:DUF4349 domain-containing protein [Longimicrobium terrae]|uniref:DUF4349 domain-containing protein n=1 Tax=Longimicrobium terrae TaxID=1639882 RepID=A0A841H769_9BACT|nr:DUF4349 domain-containing protein [Longimicrobium terrae]MBB4638256.1 hypothetical protein [Longimicrobium terrae]MBB6073774.1 hypothetical protein [Longimicrobium terrae]NNC30267.1 DUF4349 domain-containing protein [Longimicrobium terrae]
MRICLHPAILTLTFALAACSGGGDAGESSAATADIAWVDPSPAATRSGGGYAPSLERTTASAAANTTPLPADTTAGAATETLAAQPAAVTLNPMLVRTGVATLQVDSLETGIARIRQLASRVGGIIGNTTITAGSDETRQATVELRVPGDRFDEAVTGLNPIGKVESANVTAQDVGEEYTDLTARAANARRLEARLLELLDTRNGKLDEVLNMEREVARVREEIERMDGRLRYLRTRASVSTLTITLHEDQPVMSTPGERPIWDAFVSSWHNFVGLIAGVVAMLGWLIPLLFVLYGAWRVWKWVRIREMTRDAEYREAIRRERARTAAPDEEPAIRS